MNPETQTLFIDADDTLWENNIYFEQVIDGFVVRLGSHGIPAERAHQVLWETEQRNVQVTGYGSQAFCQSLHEVAGALGVDDLEPWIAEQERLIFHHPIQLLPGVAEALPRLHDRHQLILLSKGRPDEQRGKLERSGLAPWFHAVEIVFEKTADTYRGLLQEHALHAAATWMVGNSPRSDINPAREAGLSTVFIPYHTTWQHELEELAPGAATLVLSQFGELTAYFAPGHGPGAPS